MPKFTKRKLAMIALILDEEEMECNKAKRQWVHEMFTKRKEEGEYYTLFKELENDEIRFYKYFRMYSVSILLKFTGLLNSFI